MMSSPFIMKEYYKDPVKTAEVLDDGWLRTGDQGRIDEEGYLYITGRVKDTFKTAKGEFIIPGPMESDYASNVDIEQICIVGLGCEQPLALVNLSEIGLAKSKEDLIEGLEETRKQVNQNQPNYQKIAKIVIIKEDWAVDNGCLTPTLKVKRNVVNQKYNAKCLKWQHESDTILFEKN